jgi:hypothetical protein
MVSFSMQFLVSLKLMPIDLVYDTLQLPGARRMEHDVGLRPIECEFPTVVVMSSRADSRSKMEWEMHQWMKSSDGGVQKAILLTWTSISQNEVACDLEVYVPEFAEDADEDEPEIIGGRRIQQEV